MARLVRITGVRKIRVNLKTYMVDQGRVFSIGLRRAGIFLQHKSQKITPVLTGTLRNTAFTRRFGSGYRTDVVVGYTAKYAAFVHEDLDKAHGRQFNELHASEIASAHTPSQKRYFHTRGENQQAKFLEKPAREKRPEMLAIIASEASSIL